MNRHSLRPLFISSTLVCSVGNTSLWCQAENWTWAFLTASRCATNWAMPHHMVFWIVFSSAEWFGPAFGEFPSIFVPWYMVRSGIMGVCFYFCFKLFLLRKGSKHNCESFLFRGTTGIGNNHVFGLIRLPPNYLFVQSSRPWPGRRIPKFCIYRPCLLDMRTALASHLSQRSAADQ